ncbi:hypothetical protein ANO14919_131330 [Xylariales sp. No.14919]|nr:hypothetical protein ANO14919_131330 [Xylariales sp. No.14919]
MRPIPPFHISVRIHCFDPISAYSTPRQNTNLAEIANLSHLASPFLLILFFGDRVFRNLKAASAIWEYLENRDTTRHDVHDSNGNPNQPSHSFLCFYERALGQRQRRLKLPLGALPFYVIVDFNDNYPFNP